MSPALAPDLRRKIARALANGPRWKRSFQRVRAVLDAMIAAGEVAATAPARGRPPNMVELTPLGAARWLDAAPAAPEGETTAESSAPPAVPSPTGAELATRLRAEARRRGVSLPRLLAPLGGKGNRYVADLARARAPKPHTVARIEALLAGQPIPPPRRYVSQPVASDGGAAAVAAAPPAVERDPCFWCGTRADIGCRHRRAA